MNRADGCSIIQNVIQNSVFFSIFSGIGKETARRLSRLGAKIIIGSRNVEKSKKAAQEIQDETGNEVTALALDLASFESVQKFAQEVLSIWCVMFDPTDTYMTLKVLIFYKNFKLLHQLIFVPFLINFKSYEIKYIKKSINYDQ